MRDHRCPDCGVTMEAVRYRIGGTYRQQISTGESKTGLLGKPGASEWKDLTTVMCPECGLVRHFADFEE